MLTPEEKQGLAKVLALLKELLTLDDGAGEEMEPVAEVTPVEEVAMQENKPEEEKMEKEEKPTEEVGDKPADERVGGIEEDEIEGNKAVKELLSLLIGKKLTKAKAKPVEDDKLTQVLKKLGDELVFQRTAIEDLYAGLGLDTVIEKQVVKNQKPFAQSNAAANSISIESIQKAIDSLNVEQQPTNRHESRVQVRKDLGGVLKTFGNHPLWNPDAEQGE
jgi:hypothetical protein